MRRIRLTVEYDGTNYGGWQLQDNAPTVQGCLEQALFELTGERTRITGASRTDAGVHAKGQVAHFDTESNIPADRFSYALNTHLPPDIRVQDSCEAAEGFHSRFWTSGKRYSYTIFNKKHASALLAHRSWHVYRDLDVDKMQRAANDLVGTHDFAAFCATGGSAKTTVRTLHDVRVERMGDCVIITVEGNAFLYNMVRIIAGTLVGVGDGDLPEDIVLQMFSTLDRRIGGVTAPPQGLILDEVFHHDEKPEWVL